MNGIEDYIPCIIDVKMCSEGVVKVFDTHGPTVVNSILTAAG